MNAIQVNDAASNFPEVLEYYTDFIRRSENYKTIFETVYSSNKTKWTVDELSERSGLTRSATSKAARAMANKGALRRISSGSGRQTIYGKSEFPRNHAGDIRRDINRSKAESSRPTKRSPQVTATSNSKRSARQSNSQKAGRQCNVLYLTASPATSTRLRVDKEISHVQEHIQRSKYRDQINVHARPAASAKNLVEGLNDLRPNIVHFSGHADVDGIELDTTDIANDGGKFLSFDLFRDVLRGTSTPPSLVILNGCNTGGGVKALLEVVPAVISMNDSVGDTEAIVFAASFYAAIGAKQPLDKCFEQGVTGLKLVGSADSHIPQLDLATGTKAANIKLIG
ncbi:MAG: CHAT domain-containing protein [Hyphomonadaceae bacterium]|nr:CHAT domain-containing protein [Hyphomonadaceae bacterium]